MLLRQAKKDCSTQMSVHSEAINMFNYFINDLLLVGLILIKVEMDILHVRMNLCYKSLIFNLSLLFGLNLYFNTLKFISSYMVQDRLNSELICPIILVPCIC